MPPPYFLKLQRKSTPLQDKKILTKIYDFVVVQWAWTKSTKKKKPKNGEEEGDLTTAGAEDANIGVDKGRQTQ